MTRKRPTGKVLLVEGPNDQHVLWALLTAHESRIPDRSFVIDPCGSDTELLENLQLRLKAGNDTHLGVILDADTDLTARWASVRNMINAMSPESMPKSPVAEGTIAQLSADLRVGVWLMPNNQLPGMLEDFLSFLVPDGDVLWTEAATYVDEARSRGASFIEQHRSKARIHAWLAVQKQPGKPLGQAITARYLDASAEAVAPLLAWLERLFLR
jgi:hypothetical protein